MEDHRLTRRFTQTARKISGSVHYAHRIQRLVVCAIKYQNASEKMLDRKRAQSKQIRMMEMAEPAQVRAN
jgi:hypothetical protein